MVLISMAVDLQMSFQGKRVDRRAKRPVAHSGAAEGCSRVAVVLGVSVKELKLLRAVGCEREER